MNITLNIESMTSNISSQLNFSASSRVNRTTNDILQIPKESYLERCLPPQKKGLFRKIIDICRALLKKQGVHSIIAMSSAGFRYTDNGDAACCDVCGLLVSDWTLEMKPFSIHAQRSPTCSFVRTIVPDGIIPLLTMMNPLTITSETSADEQPTKRQKTETTQEIHPLNPLIEINMLKLIRKRTFSHWSPRASPSSAQMIAAGFFSCNVGDRVICLYCNLICQRWIQNTDDPFQAHKILSPKCPYVIAILKYQQSSSIQIINDYSTNDHSLTSSNIEPFRSNEIVFTAACHAAFVEIPKRLTSFVGWPNENLPSVDDLVRAGFFYTGTKTIVTCFYCNGSLQNWGSHDNPTIEHARWFPQCAYIKQLCGAELYRRIQESKQAQQARNASSSSNQESEKINNSFGRGQLNLPDESAISRYVAARLDLVISQTLLNRNFKLSIIKRCWEDQLRFKHDDFVDDCDLLVAAIILQKQIEHIDGKKENIIIPSVAINEIRKKEQEAIHAREQTVCSSSLTNASSTTDVEMSTSSESVRSELEIPITTTTNQQTNNLQSSVLDTTTQSQTDNSSPSNPCVLCLTEEKRLACIPCGHLATCVPCGHSLRLCPICRREIDAFVRIYI